MAGLRRCQGRLPALLFMGMLAATPVRGEPSMVGEPGHVARDGSWILPVAPFGDPASSFVWSPEAFEVRDGERRVPVAEIVDYALQGGDRLLAAAVLFDPLRGDEGRTVSAEPVAAALRRLLVRPGVLATVALGGPEIPEVPRPGEGSAEDWITTSSAATADGHRLWDGVLAVLTTLSGSDLPDRRVLILVSDGREDTASRLVPASCIDAALRARVAIYVISAAAGPGREADESRLRELAERTGGRLVALAGEPDRAVADQAASVLVGRIAAVRGLRFTDVGGELPATLDVRRAGAEEPAFRGVVAARQSLSGSGRWRWLLLGCGVLATAAAGLVLWRQRDTVVGDLLVTTRKGARRFPVPRRGVTIGSDRDNNLVLPSRRVSRHHAVVRVREGNAVITDLRSTRGTSVNGRTVVTHVLADGDRILVGQDVELVFRGARATGRRGQR